MSDGTPAEAGGAPAQGGGGGGAGGGRGVDNGTEHKLNDVEHKALHESVKQLRITKSVYDQYVSGDATPLSRPLSRHSIDLDDYFVSHDNTTSDFDLGLKANMMSGRTTRPRWPLQASILHAYARLRPSTHDRSNSLHRSLGNLHYVLAYASPHKT